MDVRRNSAVNRSYESGGHPFAVLARATDASHAHVVRGAFNQTVDDKGGDVGHYRRVPEVGAGGSILHFVAGHVRNAHPRHNRVGGVVLDIQSSRSRAISHSGERHSVLSAHADSAAICSHANQIVRVLDKVSQRVGVLRNIDGGPLVGVSFLVAQLPSGGVASFPVDDGAVGGDVIHEQTLGSITMGVSANMTQIVNLHVRQVGRSCTGGGARM